MKISPRYHRLFIYDVKMTTERDGIVPSNISVCGVILYQFISVFISLFVSESVGSACTWAHDQL